jgi:hypothetical protein
MPNIKNKCHKRRFQTSGAMADILNYCHFDFDAALYTTQEMQMRGSESGTSM